MPSLKMKLLSGFKGNLKYKDLKKHNDKPDYLK